MRRDFTQAEAFDMFTALQVVALTPATRAWLEANDPQALQQVTAALTLTTRPERRRPVSEHRWPEVDRRRHDDHGVPLIRAAGPCPHGVPPQNCADCSEVGGAGA